MRALPNYWMTPDHPSLCYKYPFVEHFYQLVRKHWTFAYRLIYICFCKTFEVASKRKIAVYAYLSTNIWFYGVTIKISRNSCGQIHLHCSFHTLSDFQAEIGVVIFRFLWSDHISYLLFVLLFHSSYKIFLLKMLFSLSYSFISERAFCLQTLFYFAAPGAN